MNRTFTKMKFEFLICWDLRTNADNYWVINILDDSTVNFECIFPIKINVIIPFTFLSSNMHTDQQNNPIRITLCGFPVLFSQWLSFNPVSYTHLRAHETVLDLVCRLLLEKKKTSLLLFCITLFYNVHIIYIKLY